MAGRGGRIVTGIIYVVQDTNGSYAYARNRLEAGLSFGQGVCQEAVIFEALHSG